MLAAVHAEDLSKQAPGRRVALARQNVPTGQWSSVKHMTGYDVSPVRLILACGSETRASCTWVLAPSPASSAATFPASAPSSATRPARRPSTDASAVAAAARCARSSSTSRRAEPAQGTKLEQSCNGAFSPSNQGQRRRPHANVCKHLHCTICYTASSSSIQEVGLLGEHLPRCAAGPACAPGRRAPRPPRAASRPARRAAQPAAPPWAHTPRLLPRPPDALRPGGWRPRRLRGSEHNFGLLVLHYEFAPEHTLSLEARKRYQGWRYWPCCCVPAEPVWHTRLGCPTANSCAPAWTRGPARAASPAASPAGRTPPTVRVQRAQRPGRGLRARGLVQRAAAGWADAGAPPS